MDMFVWQCIDRQTCCFKNAGVEAKNIYADKASGKDFHRESYVKLMRRLKSEDELFVKSAEEIRIARQKGVVFGRAKIDMPDNFYAVAIKWQRGQVNLREGQKCFLFRIVRLLSGYIQEESKNL